MIRWRGERSFFHLQKECHEWDCSNSKEKQTDNILSAQVGSLRLRLSGRTAALVLTAHPEKQAFAWITNFSLCFPVIEGLCVCACMCVHARVSCCCFLGEGGSILPSKFFGCVGLCVNYTASSRGPKWRTIRALLMGIGVEEEDSHQVFSGFLD